MCRLELKVLESQGVTPQDIEDMLDELQEHGESNNMANDHSIGCLVPRIGYLKNSQANIRVKAADAVSTIVQNNPRGQQLVMEANGLEPLLLNFTFDPDVTVRNKALGAISSLIRHKKTGISAFRLANGYAALRDALSSEDVRFKHCDIVTEIGFPCLMMHHVSSEDPKVREAALQGLLELAQDRPEKPECISNEDGDRLKEILQDWFKGISETSAEDLGAAREER